MTPEQRIDAALDSVLKASGSALRHYTMPRSLADMREAMRKVISDAYIKGSNDTIEAIKKAGHNVQIHPATEDAEGDCSGSGGMQI